MKSSTTIRKTHGLRMLILVMGTCLAILTAGTSVNAASCIDLSDIPLDALEQAAPGLVFLALLELEGERSGGALVLPPDALAALHQALSRIQPPAPALSDASPS